MKRLNFYLALLFTFATSIISFAHDFELNGIYYNINDDGTSVSVTYKGDSFDLYNEYIGIVFIPEKVTFALKQYDVVSIGDYAFENCNNLRYISIPNTITSIGEMSFKNCTSLKNVILGSSLSYIKDEAFYGCTSIETITSLNVTPPNAYNNIFESYLFSNTTLYIKADSYGKYWSDSYWRNFTKVERFENTISSLIVEPKIVLNLNKSFSLTPSSDPEENVISKFVFYSNNEDIASVSGNGVITANNIGFTDIYVYTIDGSGTFAKCNVLTQYTKAESLSLSKTVMFINQYDSTILYCNILPEDTHNKTVEWTVNDESIIAIRENGSGSIEILGLIEGTTEVICKTTDGSNLCATCEVTVGNQVDGDKKFTKAKSIVGGNSYLMYISSAGIAATAVDATKTYGYLYTQAVTETSGTITASSALGFTFEATTGGYFIKDTTGRYLYMTGTYNSFNMADAPNAIDAGYIWAVTIQADGTAQIMNTGMSKWIQYSAQYTSFGAYNSQSGENPVLYVMEGGSSGGGTTPEPTPGTGEGSADSPFAVNQVISGAASGTGVWVKGFIVGWVDGKTIADGAKFNDEATIQTSFLIADNVNETDYTKCIPVQLPSGAVRTALNLQTNPGNYKKEVSLKGDIATYFGVIGLKTVTEYSFDGSSSSGGDTPEPTPDPIPSGHKKFNKVSSVTANKTYLMYIPSVGIAAEPITTNNTHGFLYPQNVEEKSGSIIASTNFGFTFEETMGGYFIKDSNNRYLYITNTYSSFNVADTADASDASYIWTVSIQADGTAQILNTGMNKWIQYAQLYKFFGVYNSQSGENPILYMQVDSELGSTDMEYVDEFEIYTDNNTLHISGDFEIVEVYNLSGIKIYSGNNNEITLDSGIYIVKINNKAIKIAL